MTNAQVTEVWHYWNGIVSGICEYEGTEYLFWLLSEGDKSEEYHRVFALYEYRSGDFESIDWNEDQNWWSVLRMDARPVLHTIDEEYLHATNDTDWG